MWMATTPRYPLKESPSIFLRGFYDEMTGVGRPAKNSGGRLMNYFLCSNTIRILRLTVRSVFELRNRIPTREEWGSAKINRLPPR